MKRGLINHDKKFIMFWNAKVACQHQKKWFIKSNNILNIKNKHGDVVSVDSNLYGPHHYCRVNLKNLNFKKMNPKLQKYYKFIMLRDPAERLVSFYKDKIVMQRWGGHRDSANSFSLYEKQSIKNLADKLPGREEMNIEPKMLSFDDLVSLLYQHRDQIAHFDQHIGAQEDAYGGINLDFIGLFSNFKKDFGFIEKKFDCYLDIRANNSTEQSKNKINNVSFMKAKELRGISMPIHKDFINKDNLKKIKIIYKTDYNIINEKFGV